MGLNGYYRKFIPNFSAISAPISNLTKKGQPSKVRWGQEQENSFVTLINQLSQSPILCLPNFEKEFILQTNASDTGIVAVFLQEYDGYRFLVYYASKKILDREKKYSAIEKECLAIALRKRLRIRSVISVNYHYVTNLCQFNLLIRIKCFNTV